MAQLLIIGVIATLALAGLPSGQVDKDGPRPPNTKSFGQALSEVGDRHAQNRKKLGMHENLTDEQTNAFFVEMVEYRQHHRKNYNPLEFKKHEVAWMEKVLSAEEANYTRYVIKHERHTGIAACVYALIAFVVAVACMSLYFFYSRSGMTLRALFDKVTYKAGIAQEGYTDAVMLEP